MPDCITRADIAHIIAGTVLAARASGVHVACRNLGPQTETDLRALTGWSAAETSAAIVEAYRRGLIAAAPGGRWCEAPDLERRQAEARALLCPPGLSLPADPSPG